MWNYECVLQQNIFTKDFATGKTPYLYTLKFYENGLIDLINFDIKLHAKICCKNSNYVFMSHRNISTNLLFICSKHRMSTTAFSCRYNIATI